MCSDFECPERRLQIKCIVIALQEYCWSLTKFLMATLKVSGHTSGVLVFLVMSNADLLALYWVVSLLSAHCCKSFLFPFHR